MDLLQRIDQALLEANLANIPTAKLAPLPHIYNACQQIRKLADSGRYKEAKDKIDQLARWAITNGINDPANKEVIGSTLQYVAGKMGVVEEIVKKPITEESNRVTKTFKITAHPESMKKLERFLCFLHYNGGHSGVFAMSFDGDGHEYLKCDPEPDAALKDGMDEVYGKDVEVATDSGFMGYKIAREHDERD